MTGIIVETYEIKNKRLNVFADQHIYAGTKDRASGSYIKSLITKDPKIDTLMYTSSYNGFGSVACASAAKEHGLHCILVLCLKGFGHQNISSIAVADKSVSVVRARSYGAEVFYANTWKDMVIYAQKIIKDNIIWIPLGFKDDLYVSMMSQSIKTALQSTSLPEPVQRIFVVGGSGVIARILADVFQSAIIVVVPIIFYGQSFDKLKSYASMSKNITILDKHYVEKECPYETIKYYDSRAWDSAVSIGKNGDYVWNVAG